MAFMHLHVHSSYSLLQGAFRVEQVIDRAVGRGQRFVALTDTNGLYGAVEFYRTAREAGVTPVIGTELVYGGQQCVCLAANREGYSNLCRLVTERRLAGTPHAGQYGKDGRSERVQYGLAESIAAHSDGLFVLTATPGLLVRLAEVVEPGRLYAEWRADETHSFEVDCPEIASSYSDEDCQPETGSADPDNPGRESLSGVADRLGIPRVATVNVNFLNPEDRETHGVLCAIRENESYAKVVGDERLLAGEKSYFMEEHRIRSRLGGGREAEEAMENTVRIAEACELDLELGTPHFPCYDAVPDGETPASRLRSVAEQGARERYGHVSGEVRERLDRELSVIEQLGFCDYFLVVWDILTFARREGIPHVGRGSAANSIVSYCLGISAVDPIKYDLYFERFLNEYRTDIPDIDMDFCWRRRDEVLEYVYDRYPAGQVAMVSTHSTFRARSAFRDVARVMGLPMDEIDKYSSMLTHHSVSSVPEAMRKFPEMSDFPIQREPWRSVLEHAVHIDGYVRHLGIHLGGMVIGDRALSDYAPLEDSTKGIVVTQYEMEAAEDVGLVKIDLLGQRSLSILDRAVESIERNHGVEIDVEDIPDEDERTARLLGNGRTLGCFQIESPGMRQLLQMLEAGSIMDVIQGLSLIRPGPSHSGMKEAFIRRKRGEEEVTYRTPRMEEALSGTYGVMLYQEDILKVAQVVAGFSLAEGDQLRKRITKDRSPENLAELRERFVEGAIERDVEPKVAEQIWKEIEGFAAYSYCKAHATTYGHISYQAAWLKAHWPAEFIASVIANQAGFYDPATYYRDARRFNVKILPPSVNASGVESQPETVEGPGRGQGAIRPGLRSVRSLRRDTIKRLLSERDRGEFASFEDFCARVECQDRELENLVLAGAFDWTGESRPTLMMKLEVRPSPSPGSRDGSVGQLFEDQPIPTRVGDETAAYDIPSQPGYSLAERVGYELKMLGMAHSGHPLDVWEDEGRRNGQLRSYNLSRKGGQRVVFTGWLVTMRRAVTRDRRQMKFLCLEDRHGMVEVAVFPDAYQRCGRELSGGGVYRVEGTVKEQHGAYSLVADGIQRVGSV